MTPEVFTTFCTSWIDAVATVLVHLGGKLALVIALPAYVQLRNRLNRHRADIEALKPAAPATPPAPPAEPAAP